MNIQFGAAFFEDSKSPGTAMMAKAGGSGGQRIGGTEHLSSDVVWLTNLSSEVMYSRKLHNNARLRDDKYLRPKISSVLESVGLKEEGDEVKTQVTADLFSRVVRVAHKALGFDYIPHRSLRQGVREVLGGPDNTLPEALVRAIEDATKFYTSCQQTTSAASEDKTFFLPPVEHAEAILSSPVPDGEWTHKRKAKLPSSSDIVGWIAETGPVLVRVTINQIDPAINALLNYGDDLKDSKGNRQWVTANELLSLVNMASEVTLHEAFVPETCITYDALISGVLDRFSHECNMLSLSWGMFLDNLWTGVGTSYRPRRQGGASLTANPATPFLRAYDRLRCLEAALQLQGLGFDVQSYGTGKVVVNGAQAKYKELFLAARATGLLPPIGDLSLEEMEVDDKDLDNPLTLMQTMYAQGDSAEILNFDREVVEEVILTESA